MVTKGEIWIVNYEPSRKGELGKTNRPSVVFQADDASELIDTVTLIPISSDTDQYNEIHVRLKPNSNNGLKKESSALCSHLYTLSKTRLVKKIGILNSQELSSVTRAVILHLDLESLWF